MRVPVRLLVVGCLAVACAPASAWACNSVPNNAITADGATTDWDALNAANDCAWKTSQAQNTALNPGLDLQGVEYTHNVAGDQQYFVMKMYGPLVQGATYTFSYAPSTAGFPTVVFTISWSRRNGWTGTNNVGLPTNVSINAATGVIEMSGSPIPSQYFPDYQNSTITASITPPNGSAASPSLTIRNVSPSNYTGATAATLLSFQAYRSSRGVELRWETGAETGNFGFVVHRDRPDGPAVNPELVPGLLTAPLGRRYALRDLRGRADTRYYLEEVGTDGRHSFGPASLERGPAPRLEQRGGLRLPASASALLVPRARWHRGGAQASQGFVRVASEGIYAIDPAAVRSLGLPPGHAALSHDGAAWPLFRAPGGALAFYAPAPSSPERANDAYELDLGSPSTAGVAIALGPGRAAPASTFAANVHVEEHHQLDPGAPAELRFPWTSVFTGWPAQVSFDAPGYAGGPVTVSVNLLGESDFGLAVEHHVALTVNGQPLTDAKFGGLGEAAFSATLPAGVLQPTGNTLGIAAVDDLGVPYDIVALSSLDLQYARSYVADGDLLAFTADARTPVSVGGFSAPPVVLDVTDPSQPRVVMGAEVRQQSGSYVVAFRELFTRGTRSYLAAVPRTASLEASRAGEVPSGGAQWVAITGEGLDAALQPLVTFRAGQGLSTLTVPVEALYDKFGHGEHGPAAIRAYLAQLQPAPESVVLVGKPSVDPHDYLGTGTADLVPAPIVLTHDYNTIAAFDAQYVAGADGRTPFAAVGRLPVRDGSELSAFVDKLLAFERGGGPSGLAVFAADDHDPATGAADPFFQHESDALAAQLPLQALPVYLPGQGKQDLLAALARAPDLVTYHGHADGLDWSTRGLLAASDVPQLPAVRPFMLVTVDCWDGLFAMPNFDSLAQQLVEVPQGGAVAAFSASSLVDEANDPALDAAVFPALADTSAQTVGQVSLRAQTALAGLQGHAAELLRVYDLIGDPATRNPLH